MKGTCYRERRELVNFVKKVCYVSVFSQDANASARRAEAARKREEDIAAGTVQMNGRELFTREPWVFDNSRY